MFADDFCCCPGCGSCDSKAFLVKEKHKNAKLKKSIEEAIELLRLSVDQIEFEYIYKSNESLTKEAKEILIKALLED